MGMASPLQSGKPIEYWLDGLLTKELVQLWEFLSRNLDNMDPKELVSPDNMGSPTFPQGSEDLPPAKEVRETLYSESLPSSFYACKDRGDLRSS